MSHEYHTKAVECLYLSVNLQVTTALHGEGTSLGRASASFSTVSLPMITHIIFGVDEDLVQLIDLL